MYKRLSKLLVIGMVFSSLLFAAALPAQSAFAINVTTSPSGAAGPCNNPDAASQPKLCPDTTPAGDPVFGPNGIVTVIVKILSLVVGFLALIFIVVEAIRMTVSSGDPQAVSSARDGIIYAFVGLIVAVLAQTLVAFVLDKVG